MRVSTTAARLAWIQAAAGLSAWALSLTALAASPLAFEVPQAQQAQFGAIASDPTIRPFNQPGVQSPILLYWSADLLGQGRPDLILCHGSYPPDPRAKRPCRVLRPQADGSAIDVTRQLFGAGALPSAEHAREIVTADFNGDGRADIFIAAHGYDTAPFDGETNTLLVSNADGTYADRSATLPQAPDFSHSACSGDVNGDGKLDLYVGNVDAKVGPYLLVGRGDGTFLQTRTGLPAVILPALGDPADETSLACAFLDVDGDGDEDLVLGAVNPSGSTYSSVYFNDGSGDFTQRARATLPAGTFGTGNTLVVDLLPLDVDRDGRPDLMVLSEYFAPGQFGGFGLQVLVNKGGGAFADETVARLGPAVSRTTPPYCNFLRVADFDGDGWEDFYCGTNNWSSSLPCVWMNQRDGTWVGIPGESMPPGSNCGGVQDVDFDGDGRPDLIQAGSNADADIFYRSYLNRTPRTVPSEPVIGRASAGNGSASIEFVPPLGSGAAPVASYTAACRVGSMAALTATGAGSPIGVTGLVNGKAYACTVTATSAAGTSLPSRAVRVVPSASAIAKSAAVEFHHAAFDHYFVTSIAGEIASLDSGAFAGWTRTGKSFRVYASPGAPAATVSVCRYFSSAFAPKSSHFYSASASECTSLAPHPDWQYEGQVFNVALPSLDGNCPTGHAPVYRLYNQGKGNAPNHRFTTDPAVRTQMLAQGFVAEGYGIGVSMCAAD